MDSTEDKVRRIEQSIRESVKEVEFAEALQRLQNNRDFKRVVLDGYLTQEAVRLVHLMSDPAVQDPATQQSIHLQLRAVGELNAFFQRVVAQAGIARKNIAYSEQAREELIQGEE